MAKSNDMFACMNCVELHESKFDEANKTGWKREKDRIVGIGSVVSLGARRRMRIVVDR